MTLLIRRQYFDQPTQSVLHGRRRRGDCTTVLQDNGKIAQLRNVGRKQEVHQIAVERVFVISSAQLRHADRHATPLRQLSAEAGQHPSVPILIACMRQQQGAQRDRRMVLGDSLDDLGARVNPLPIALAHARLRKARTLLGCASSALALLIVGLMFATHSGLTAGFSGARDNHLVVLNKIAPFTPMPVSYASRIEGIEGVVAVGYDVSFRGYYKQRRNAVSILGVHKDSFFDIQQDELMVDAGARQRWLDDRTGALVSDTLAQKYGWRAGDDLPLLSDLMRRDGSTTWYVNIEGIYRRQDGSQSQAIFVHYDYVNESRLANRDTVDSFDVIVAQPGIAARVSDRVDTLFASGSPPTRTSPLSAILQGILRQAGDIGSIMLSVSGAVLAAMVLLGIAIGINSNRERREQHALLRAVGYTRLELFWIVLTEPFLVAVLGGLFGILLSHALVSAARAPLAEILNDFSLSAAATAGMVMIAVLLGLTIGIPPALSAIRINIAAGLKPD